jgi:hypothetical protein
VIPPHRRSSAACIATIAIAIGISCARPAGPIGLVRVAPIAVDDQAHGVMDVAELVARGNVGVMIHVDRVRPHPSAYSITRLSGWGDLLEQGGLDPIFDIERVFIAAPAVVSCRPVIAFEHTLGEERVGAVMRALLDESHSPRNWVEGLGFPAIEITPRKKPQLFAAPKPGLMVMMPIDYANEARRFVDATPLPPPAGREAWTGWSNEAGWPTLPEALSTLALHNGRATFILGSTHSIALVGFSPTIDQARADAALLTKVAEEKLRIPGVGMRILDPAVFTSNGTTVSGTMRLLPSDLEWILGQMNGPCW